MGFHPPTLNRMDMALLDFLKGASASTTPPPSSFGSDRMESDARVLFITMGYDVLIFVFCFSIFLYIRKLRRDRRDRGVNLLRTTRLCRGSRAGGDFDNSSSPSSLHSPGSVPNRLADRAVDEGGVPPVPRSASLENRSPQSLRAMADLLGEEGDGGGGKLRPPGTSNPMSQAAWNPEPLLEEVRDEGEAETGMRIDELDSSDSEREESRQEAPGGGGGLAFEGREVAGDTGGDGGRSGQTSPRRRGTMRRHFKWIRELCAIEDQRFQSTDVQFYLLFLKTAIRLFSALSVISILIALPVNYTAPIRSGGQGWLDRAAVENITSPNHWRIWIVYAETWLYSTVAYWYIFSFWRQIRDPHLLNHDELCPEAFTLIVKGIDRRKIDPHAIRQYFECLYPDQVVAVHLVLDYGILMEAERRLQEKVKRLLKAHSIHRQQGGLAARRLSLPIGCHPPPSARHSTASPRSPSASAHETSVLSSPSSRLSREADVRYWEEQVAEQTRELNLARRKLPTENAGVAFVSFRSTACLADCLSEPRVTGPYFDWKVDQAPPPGDIVWSNIHLSDCNRFCRMVIVNTIVFVASILLTSSAMLTNALLPLAENVEKAFEEADFLKLSISGWGAPLILYGVNSLCIPILVWWGALVSGHWRVSSQASAVLHGNIIFLVLSTVIFPALGTGSIGAILYAMYTTEIQKWNVSLARLLVGQSGSFALRYTLNGCLLSSSAQLLQLPQWSYQMLLNCCGCEAPQWFFDFGYWYAFSLSLFTMGLLFSVAIPVLVPCTALFFVFKYWVDKYNFTFGIWRAEQESAGAVAAVAVHYMALAVAFLQFVMSGFFLTVGLRSSTFGGRALTLGGTVLFVTSILSFILLLGHSTPSCGRGPSGGPLGRGESRWLRDPRVRESNLLALREAYEHPCEKEKRNLVMQTAAIV